MDLLGFGLLLRVFVEMQGISSFPGIFGHIWAWGWLGGVYNDGGRGMLVGYFRILGVSNTGVRGFDFRTWDQS